MTWLRTLGGVACAVWLAGCQCASTSTLGGPCDTDRDCAAPEVCGGAGVCELPEVDAGARDTGAGDAGSPDVGAGDANTGCADDDADGITVCASDCDDHDPTTYPGASEVCGDGVDNACGSMPDAGCGGIGTYVAPAPLGVDTNPGTQAMPVATIAQGLRNATTIGGGADVYVAAGTYVEDLTMIEGTSLLGGYESSTWTRDPAANVTTIEPVGVGGVTFPTGITRATEIDGFTIGGASLSANGASITVMDGASPTISNNIVVGPDSSAASWAINVNPNDAVNAGLPLIEDNVINLGAAATGWGANNGAVGVRSRQSVVEVLRNRINLPDDDSHEWGLAIYSSPPTSLLEGNVIRGTGTVRIAFGIAVGGSNVIVRDNDVDLGRVSGGTHGIQTGGASGTTQLIENNIVFGGNATGRSIAFTIEYEGGGVPSPPPDITVHSNFFHGGTGTGVTIGIMFGECPANPGAIGRFYNNVVYSGTGATRWAVSENHPNIEPAAMMGNALFLMPGGTAGALYRDEGNPALGMGCLSGTPGADLTLAAVNALTGNGMNIETDCAVTSPVVGGDFHLGAGSMCIDAGVSTALPTTDYEGDPRPSGAGPDIGPDET